MTDITPTPPVPPTRKPGRPVRDGSGPTLAAASLDDPARTLSWAAGTWYGSPELVADARALVADAALVPVTPTGPYLPATLTRFAATVADAAAAGLDPDDVLLTVAAVLETVLRGRAAFAGDLDVFSDAFDRLEARARDTHNTGDTAGDAAGDDTDAAAGGHAGASTRLVVA